MALNFKSSSNITKKYALYLMIVWTSLIVISVSWNTYQTHEETIEKARIEARTIFENNNAYRKWIAMLGGIYARVSDSIQPNTYLSVPDRDVTTTDGTRLTLINSSWMTRMVSEITREQSHLPIVNRAVSLKYLNPVNKPDEWEKKALLDFEKGISEVNEISTINGEPYMRIFKPRITEESCLKCHGHQGYKVGDVRGGMSIAVPLKPYYEGEARTRKIIAITHLLLWLVGTGGIVTLTRNIQGQQQKITESESKFRTLSEFAYDWEYWIKDNMEIVFMSPSCERLTGYTQEEFLNNSHLLCDIVHPDDRAVCDMHMRDFTASQHDEIEFRIITKNGETRWLSHICGPINVEKKFLGRRVSNRDITDRKTAEIKLESAIKDWQNTFNTIEDSIVILSPDNRILKANLATSRLLSIPLEDIVGKRCYEIFHKMDTNYKGCPHLKTLTLGKSEHLVFESEQVNKIFEVTVTPVMGDGNEILSTIHIVKDITGRKKLEEQLVQSQKMESLGLLAGGIAHDFNNLLTAITGYSSLLEEGLQDSDEKTKRYVQHIMSASEKAQNLTSNLLTFSRKQIIKPSSVSLNEVIENISGLLKRLIGEDIDLRLRCSDAEFPVFADPHQIEQVVMNLVTNARDAMPSGGMVSIETAPVMLDSEYAEKRGVKAGRYMMLSVSDSGTGIDKNELAHIFEPFFTTKEKGKGTGLGLSMVYSIIKQHGGFIDLYSEKNIGTTFKLYIPASTFIENSQQKRDDSKPRKDVSGRETILVAEDEELVREFLKDIFETYGYKAIIAVDGEDAIAKYNEHKEHVDMIVLDVIMPRKNGKEVYNYIREINPDIKTLFISGYTQGILTSRGVCEEDLEFVSKPLEAHGLMSKIRSILDKNASEGCVSSAESP